MSEPTEDRWADARRVLERRTPDSELVVGRYGAAIVGPGGRTACGLLLTGLATSDDHADNLDALSLSWNVLPDLLAERDRYRAAMEHAQWRLREVSSRIRSVRDETIGALDDIAAGLERFDAALAPEKGAADAD